MQTLKWLYSKNLVITNIYQGLLKTHSFLEPAFDKHLLPKSSFFIDVKFIHA